MDLLRQLMEKKGNSLSTEPRKAITLISDVLTDNGVRGAGLLSTKNHSGKRRFESERELPGHSILRC